MCIHETIVTLPENLMIFQTLEVVPGYPKLKISLRSRSSIIYVLSKNGFIHLGKLTNVTDSKELSYVV